MINHDDTDLLLIWSLHGKAVQKKLIGSFDEKRSFSIWIARGQPAHRLGGIHRKHLLK